MLNHIRHRVIMHGAVVDRDGVFVGVVPGERVLHPLIVEPVRIVFIH